MRFAQDNQMVNALATNRSDRSFGEAVLPPGRFGSLKAYMAGLPRALFPEQRHSSGWTFNGAFAVPDCSHAVRAEEQRIKTARSF